MHRLPAHLCIVLVEPKGSLNVGSVARLCANFGVNEIRIVSPRCDLSDIEATKMALKGAELLQKAKIFSTLLEAVADCRYVLATAARIDHGDIPLTSPDQSFKWLFEGDMTTQIALVFGREDRGLTNDELLIAQRVLKFDFSTDYSSLNLSHAVAIVLYELHRVSIQHQMNPVSELYQIPATTAEIDACLSDARNLLLDVGFLLEHTANARMSKIKALVNRTNIRPAEISMFRGIIRQIRWAINSSRS